MDTKTEAFLTALHAQDDALIAKLMTFNSKPASSKHTPLTDLLCNNAHSSESSSTSSSSNRNEQQKQQSGEDEVVEEEMAKNEEEFMNDLDDDDEDDEESQDEIIGGENQSKVDVVQPSQASEQPQPKQAKRGCKKCTHKCRFASKDMLMSSTVKSSKAEQSVEFLLDPERDTYLPKPYHLCGNSLMYTEGNISKRQKVKEHPAVLAALSKFATLYCGSEEVEESSVISKEAYVGVHFKLTKILRPSMSVEEQHQLAEEDWGEDTYDLPNGVLTWVKLQDILFTFVDVWTQTAEPSEYLLFLEQLYLKLKE